MKICIYWLGIEENLLRNNSVNIMQKACLEPYTVYELPFDWALYYLRDHITKYCMAFVTSCKNVFHNQFTKLGTFRDQFLLKNSLQVWFVELIILCDIWYMV